jgi:hypothetical protein
MCPLSSLIEELRLICWTIIHPYDTALIMGSVIRSYRNNTEALGFA